MARETRIHRLPMTGPEDVSAILAHIGRGEIAPAAIRAILGGELGILDPVAATPDEDVNGPLRVAAAHIVVGHSEDGHVT